jgi:uncharacterized protein (TIRG00374 family)
MKIVKGGSGLLSILVSALLLIVLYRALDLHVIGQVLAQADWVWLIVSVALILPITVLRAVRFYGVAPVGALPGVGEALRLTFVASAANVFLPAKTGDLVKSYFVAKRSDTSAGVSIAIVVYERACDVFGLSFWCVAGWLIGRPQVPGMPSAFWLLIGSVGAVCAVLISSTRASVAVRAILESALPQGKLQRVRDLIEGWPTLLRTLGTRRRWIVLLSLGLWLSHLFQIWLFAAALRLNLPFAVSASLAAIALMAGQLPLTLAGIGTRDVAFVVLLSQYVSAEGAAALAVLVTTRNIVPPLVGIPMMGPYVASIADEARRWGRGLEHAK